VPWWKEDEIASDQAKGAFSFSLGTTTLARFDLVEPEQALYRASAGFQV
jgi:hypothetical protein